MASRLFVAVFAATLVLALAIGSSPSTVSAHEHRTVAENYEFTVGWSGEPAVGGLPNAVFLEILFFEGGVPEEHEEGEEAEGGEGEAVEGVPLEGAEEGLGVTVTTGGGAASIELPLEPAFGEVGVYESTTIIPAPGDYSFTFTGTLPDGTTVDESFDSGPETFATVDDPATLQFPQPTADGDSSSGSSDSDDDDSDAAMMIAIVAVIIAVIATGIGIFALVRKPSS